MTKLSFIALVYFLITSCSTTRERSVASYYPPKNLTYDNLFQNIIEERIKNLYIAHLTAYYYMDRLDQLVMNGGDLLTSSDYANMMILRSYIEEEGHKLSEVQKNLFQKLKDDNFFNPKVYSLLLSFIPSKKLTKDIGRWALEEIHLQNKKIYDELMNVQVNEFAKKYSKKIKETYGDFQVENVEERWREMWKAEWKVLSKTNEFLQFESNLQKDLVVFTPSAKRAGNIVGSEYPKGIWSLTFDDGPRAKTTPLVLANLKKNGVKATFFQLAQNVEINPTLSHNVRDQGMEIGSHSYDHPDLTKLSYGERKYQIQSATDIIAKIQQRPISLYRLPYGAGVNDPDIRELIAQAGLIHVYWSVDTLDWMKQDAASVVQRTIAQIKNSKNNAGIILFHDIQDRTVEASDLVIQYLKKSGAQLCPVGLVVDQMNGNGTCP